MRNVRTFALASLAVLAVLVGWWPTIAAADAEMRLAGFADVPPTGSGGTLSLPLAPGSDPVTIHVTFGVPSLSIPVEISHSTHIDSDDGLPVSLTDGDRIIVEAVVAHGVLKATRLTIEEFPELELNGTVHGLPAAGVALPLASGTVSFTVTLGTSGVDVPVTVTAKTKVKGSFTLHNGDKVKIEAGVQNNAVVATELKR